MLSSNSAHMQVFWRDPYHSWSGCLLALKRSFARHCLSANVPTSVSYTYAFYSTKQAATVRKRVPVCFGRYELSRIVSQWDFLTRQRVAVPYVKRQKCVVQCAFSQEPYWHFCINMIYLAKINRNGREFSAIWDSMLMLSFRKAESVRSGIVKEVVCSRFFQGQLLP